MQIGPLRNWQQRLLDEWLGEPFVFNVAAHPLDDQSPSLPFPVYFSSLPGGAPPSPAIAEPLRGTGGVWPPVRPLYAGAKSRASAARRAGQTVGDWGGRNVCMPISCNRRAVSQSALIHRVALPIIRDTSRVLRSAAEASDRFRQPQLRWCRFVRRAHSKGFFPLSLHRIKP